MLVGRNAKAYVGNNPCAEIVLKDWQPCNLGLPKKYSAKKKSWKRLPKKLPVDFFKPKVKAPVRPWRDPYVNAPRETQLQDFAKRLFTLLQPMGFVSVTCHFNYLKYTIEVLCTHLHPKDRVVTYDMEPANCRIVSGPPLPLKTKVEEPVRTNIGLSISLESFWRDWKGPLQWVVRSVLDHLATENFKRLSV